MKKSRKIVMLICVFTCIMSISTLIASANTTKVINTANNTLHMEGYIDFLEGPNVIKDKIWYHGSIYGTYDLTGIMTNGTYGDNNCCYVRPGTNSDMLSRVYLYKSKTFVTSGNSGIYTGYGGTKGVLEMNLMGTKSTPTAT